MDKAFVWNLRTSAVETFDATLRDPVDNPGFSAKLTLKRHDVVSWADMLVESAKYVQKYVTGSSDVEPIALPPVGGEPLTVTEGATKFICAVLTAQVQEPKYTFEEIAAMCVSNALKSQIVELASKVSPNEQPSIEDDPDPLGRTTEGSSVSTSEGSDGTPS